MNTDALAKLQSVTDNPIGFVRSKKQRLKAEITTAKAILTKDVSKYKVGRVYTILASEDLMLITEIGPHPLSRIPTAYGLRITVNGHDHAYTPLCTLGNEFIH